MEARRVERKLSAIFAADVEAYRRLMGRDEVGTRRTLAVYRVIIDRLIASHRGRIFSTAGDAFLPILQIGTKLPLSFADLGSQRVKNISQAAVFMGSGFSAAPRPE
jgi:class 3 adenylate cyclase